MARELKVLTGGANPVLLPLNRFLVFSFTDGRTDGGWADFCASFDDVDEACDKADQEIQFLFNHAQVVDSLIGQMIYEPKR